ncbi:MAG: nucleotide exchange factor GrpE, partial [Nitrospinae bacterium]|nr:nucleotide exchange factor GrpE [Nitrospinota bacterium]
MSDDILDETLKVFDKRHWVNPEERAKDDEKEADLKRLPTYVARLEDAAAKSEAKLKEYIAAYKEKMAENDQWRERLQKDVDRRVEAGTAEFFRKITPQLDNLGLAVESAKKTGDVESLIQGILMIKSGFARILAEAGLKEIDCLGKKFNPAQMEAL